MQIPVGFGHVLIGFSGDAVPLGAAITFGIEDNTVGATPVQIAELIATAFDATDGPLDQLSSITRDLVRVKMGPNDSGPFGEFTEPAAAPSTSVTEAPMVSLLVEKQTALGGRRGRGRLYVPGLSEGNVQVGGGITPADLIAQQAAWTGFLEDLATANVPMVLLHSDATAPTPVTALSIDARAATQRRRQRR